MNLSNVNIQKLFNRKVFRDIVGENCELSDKQKHRLNLIFEKYTIKQLLGWFPTIGLFVKHDLNNYIGRLDRLRKQKNRSTLYSYILQYGKNTGYIKYIELNKKKTRSFENKIEYWLNKGFDLESATNKVKEVQLTRAKISGKLVTGKSEYTCRSISYWLKHGYSLEEAKDKVRLLQTTNGYNLLGTEKQLIRNQKRLNTLRSKSVEETNLINLKKTHSIEGVMARLGCTVEEAKLWLNQYHKKTKTKSVISQKLFDMVYSKLDDKLGIYYKSLNYEKQFSNKCIDFYDTKSKIGIEFYGNFWHADPKIFSDDDIIYSKLTARMIRAKDRERINLLLMNNNIKNIFIVWEDEFRKNPEEVVQYMVEIIKIHREE